MRVKVEISNTKKGTDDLFWSYEAKSILFTQSQEVFPKDISALHLPGEYYEAELRQVPALIVLLDSGEYKVQPLVIHNGTVKVFEVPVKLSWWKRLKGWL